MLSLILRRIELLQTPSSRERQATDPVLNGGSWVYMLLSSPSGPSMTVEISHLPLGLAFASLIEADLLTISWLHL